MAKKDLTILEDFLDEIGYRYPDGVTDTVEATMMLINNLLETRDCLKEHIDDLTSQSNTLIEAITEVLNFSMPDEFDASSYTVDKAQIENMKDAMDELESTMFDYAEFEDCTGWLYGVDYV